MPEYNGVDVEHPSVVNSIKQMLKDGRKKEDIMRVVGVPHEVVESVAKRSVD